MVPRHPTDLIPKYAYKSLSNDNYNISTFFPLFFPHNPWILRSITILNFITMNTVNTQKIPLVISFSKSILKFKIKIKCNKSVFTY